MSLNRVTVSKLVGSEAALLCKQVRELRASLPGPDALSEKWDELPEAELLPFLNFARELADLPLDISRPALVYHAAYKDNDVVGADNTGVLCQMLGIVAEASLVIPALGPTWWLIPCESDTVAQLSSPGLRRRSARLATSHRRLLWHLEQASAEWSKLATSAVILVECVPAGPTIPDEAVRDCADPS